MSEPEPLTGPFEPTTPVSNPPGAIPPDLPHQIGRYEVEKLLGKGGFGNKPQRQWYVNGQGQTMVVVPGPVEFLMGSPSTEANRIFTEGLHLRRIGRTFAIAATSVTVEQFRRFRPDFGSDQMQHHPEPACAIGGVTWLEAAKYCNWLSEQEGVPREQWCYETIPPGEVSKLRANYLSLEGYRLPSEAEWECVCRAGAVTSRFFGETVDLLGKYAWNHSNSRDHTWPGGTLKPNDWGLFDVHGNVWNWCQEPLELNRQAKGLKSTGEKEYIDDKEYMLDIPGGVFRMMRGGSMSSLPETLHAE